MSFFVTVARLVFDALPLAVIRSLVFLVIVSFLISRRRAVEKRILGQCRTPFWREVAGSAIAGILAGYLGSFILLFLGISISPDGFIYVLFLALLLTLLDLRYLCLSYAGGLLALVSLATGAPKIHVTGLMALIGVLHVTESVLILLDGDQQALPVYLRRPEGTVGGYLLQRIWPVPLLLLTMIDGTGITGKTYATPGWWPLIAATQAGVPPGVLVGIYIPAAAALGYGDLALTGSPRAKALRTSGLLALYSVTLMALAVAAGRYPALAWAAALFSPAGHELVLYLSRRMELYGKPAFGSHPAGVTILAVMPGSRAAGAGLRAGQVITAVNGRQVRSKGELVAALDEAAVLAEITTLPPAGGPERRHEMRGGANRLGIIPAPDPDEPAQVDVGPWHFLPRQRTIPP